MATIDVPGRATPLAHYLRTTSQHQLARLVGISQPAISQMLHDGRDVWVIEHRRTTSLYEWKHVAGG